MAPLEKGLCRLRWHKPIILATESGNQRAIMKSVSKTKEDIFKKVSEEINNVVDKHVSKAENVFIAILNTNLPLFNPQTEVLLDKGLSFFILSGEEGSALSQSSEQRSVNNSHSKHFSLGDNLQNVAEGPDEDFMEVIFTDLLEIKAAECEDDQEQIKTQQANIFVPSSSPGNILFLL
ncbi:protein CC2D2B homolog [Castor canadensis]|uniref:Protein CC2D2B homolog n=1 Tax=Castor canadensis TaxID=51338 RepID=A0A8B7VGA0_CASCN